MEFHIDNEKVYSPKFPNIIPGSFFTEFISFNPNQTHDRILRLLNKLQLNNAQDVMSDIKKVLISTHPYFEIYSDKISNLITYYISSELSRDTLDDLFYYIEDQFTLIQVAQEMFKEDADICLLYKDSQDYQDKPAIEKLYNTPYSNSIRGSFRSLDTARRYSSESITQSEYIIINSESGPKLVRSFNAYSVVPIAYHEFFIMVKTDMVIKPCANCGKYFTPYSRKDAIYCDRQIGKGNRTCKDAGAVKTFRKNTQAYPALAAYYRAYQARYARTVKKYPVNSLERQKALDELSIWAKLPYVKAIDSKEDDRKTQEYIAWLEANK